MATSKQQGSTQHHFGHSKNSGAGFIALVSAVIISVVLLTLVIGTGERGFSSRFNILNSELKAMSSGLAEACVETAILFLAQDVNHFITNPPPTWVPVGDRGCEISFVTPPGALFTIRTHATSSPTVTNTYLEVVVGPSPQFTPQSWKECRDFTQPC